MIIPTFPTPPEITNVTNSQAVAGNSSFKVYARITGTVQRSILCNGNLIDWNDWNGCPFDDLTMQPDPRVTPNPTCIPNSVDTSGGSNPSVCGGKSGNPMVYYYYSADPTTGGSVAMTYESDINNFTADIPLGLYEEGDTVTYYIVASDNRGNVVAQVPDTNTVPCTSISAWDSDYETPAIDNCSYMNSYEECLDFKTGTPSCGSSYSLNDSVGDTCDEYGIKDTTPNHMVDIYGISAGAGPGYQDLPGQTVVCARIRLGANPPDVGSSSGAINVYVMVFFNPDIVDPNPDDLYMPNAFVITYTTGVQCWEMPRANKVLWDGECVTNPNTADVLGCRLIVGGPDEDNLKIAADSGTLTFIANNSLPDGRTLLGSNSGETLIFAYTGEIQLDGGTPVWVTDTTASLNLVLDNQTVELRPCGAIAPPITPSTATCYNGTDYTNGTCAQSTSQPDKNTCKLTVYASPDCGFADEYKVYHNTVDNPSTATYLGSITSNLCSTNYYSHEIATLDGKTHYYFMSNEGTSGSCGTIQSDWAKTRCTVEDWVPPSAPTDLSCTTPAGNENKCHCTWTADTASDPSLRGFYLRRNSTLLTLSPWPAAAGVTDYYYTDTSAELVTGTEYTYKVRALDAGGNESPDIETTCTPEDLKAPEQVDTLGVTLVIGQPHVNLFWEEVSDEDIAGYNAWYCHNSTPGYTCRFEGDYARINSSGLISGILEISTLGNVTLINDENYCFWIQACDNCDTAGTCPGNNGAPNCSTLNTMSTHRKCVIPTTPNDPAAPLWPTVLAGETDPLVTTPLPEGGKCELKWGPICEGEMPEGTFGNCNFPTPNELMGYYILKTERQGSGCDTTTINPIPTTELPYPDGQLVVQYAKTGLFPEYTDENVVNGTEYCYRVYGFDASNNFSRQGPLPTPVSCIPYDPPVLPSRPTMNIPISFGILNCDPSWNAVTDPDTVIYTVYRCDDSPGNCTSGNFTPLLWADAGFSGNSQNTTYSDISVTTDSNYTYCITASDGVNESDIISDEATDASSEPNCGFCTPSGRPLPPSNVFAGENPVVNECGYGLLNVWWTDSPDDNGAGGMGYNVYLCSNNYCVGEAHTCCSAGPISGSPINGDHDFTMDQDPYSFNSIESFVSGNYYVGMTYQNGNGVESFPEFSGTTVNILNTDPCSTCPVISITGSFRETGLETCTIATDPNGADVLNGCPTDAFKKVYTPMSGVIVEVVDTTTDAVIASRTSDESGNVCDIGLCEGGQYNIRAKYTVGNDDPFYKYICDNASTVNSDGYCVIDMATATLSDGASVNVAALVIPYPGGGSGGGEIGNPSGNSTVGLEDISLIKAAFGASLGDTCYRAWADFNMNGQVGIEDIAIMKKYFGKVNIDTTAPDFDPTLLQSADPLPACCATKTCD